MWRKGLAWLKTHTNLLRRFSLWMVLAVAMFAVSGYLTLRITYVDNHSPLDTFNPDFGRDANGDPLPDEFHGQIISVMAPKDGDLSPVAVKYYTLGYGDTDIDKRKAAQIVFSIPAHRPLRILFNHAQNGDCVADGATPEEARNIQLADDGRSRFFTVPATKIDGEAFGVMTVPEQDDVGFIKCWLTPDVATETFTKRATVFSFTAPGGRLNYAPQMDNSARDFVDPSHDYRPYASVDAISLTVEIRGAEDLHFAGGRADPEASDYDTTRLVEMYGYTHVRWTDVFREQLRDIYLILIGTLIALAVTCVIEAIRPLVDGKLEEELEREEALADNEPVLPPHRPVRRRVARPRAKPKA